MFRFGDLHSLDQVSICPCTRLPCSQPGRSKLSSAFTCSWAISLSGRLEEATCSPLSTSRPRLRYSPRQGFGTSAAPVVEYTSPAHALVAALASVVERIAPVLAGFVAPACETESFLQPLQMRAHPRMESKTSRQPLLLRMYLNP